ncbi:MAG: RNA polymerase sigma factor [Planctomycetes bacterium]|nr:RNA polymerase sigma factor [Planctomycetota bacterium]
MQNRPPFQKKFIYDRNIANEIVAVTFQYQIAELRLGRFELNNQEPSCGAMLFRTIVEQHWDSVYRLLFHMTSNTHDAEDLTQETFMRALKSRESFSAGTNMRAWLMRIAGNAFFDLRRRRKVSRAQPLGPEELQAQPAGGRTDGGSGERNEILARAIAALPETARMVFLMRVREDMPFREIADGLHMTEATARWHMLQARRQLMVQLKDKI